MPALRKPLRVAVLAPVVTGADESVAREVGMLVWVACIDALQRHPGLACYDAESMPLFPRDGHYELGARSGSLPTDAGWTAARRDELLWAEVPLGKGALRLHAIDRSGKDVTFDALGKNLGEQLQQVLTAWLAARALPAPPKRVDPATAEELVAAARALAPALASPPKQAPLGVAAKLPAVWKLHALRLLILVSDEPDLYPELLELDPQQPQGLLAQYEAEPEPGLLRAAIAAAPGWAIPYQHLEPPKTTTPDSPTRLEIVAGAGMAALCRPGFIGALSNAATRLADQGRPDEGVRFLERAVALYPDEPQGHLLLLDMLGRSDRPGQRLAQARISARRHGCPVEAGDMWTADQILVDLALSDALLGVGRWDEAVALRGNRLEFREGSWPRHARILEKWRKDPVWPAWAYAREGWYRGDPSRTVEGFGRAAPDTALDVALFVDALVQCGRESLAPLAWAHHGLGHKNAASVSRLAAARGLFAAGEWARGLEELWRVELGAPGRDEHVAIARAGALLVAAPLSIAETALADRLAAGATTLARRMARLVADFVPGAESSSTVRRALGTLGKPLEVDAAWFAGFAADTRSRRALDAMFAELGGKSAAGEPLRADRLVERWLEVAFAEASEADPPALAEAAAYAAAQALARYFLATTAAPSALAGALRIVAAEALGLVARHRMALSDRAAKALLGAIEPIVRRVDRWVASTWLGIVERACGLDERAGGDVAGFAAEHATLAARLLGPEETAVLAASVARLHRDRPERWAAAASVQGAQLAIHTGAAGCDEWADAIVEQLAAKELEPDDALDALHTAAYLSEGRTAGPCVHAARLLFTLGRGPVAVGVLTASLGAAGTKWRDAQLATLTDAWAAAQLDVPLRFEELATQMFEALQKGDGPRAEKLGVFAAALDPSNAELHRNLGLAYAQQGKLVDALFHLARATPEQATQILAGIQYQRKAIPEAIAVLDYASRWYTRPDQWLTYGAIAFAAEDNARILRAYQTAYELDPEALNASQLNPYAAILAESGDYAHAEVIVRKLLDKGGDDPIWQSNGSHTLAMVLMGQEKWDEAIEAAEKAVRLNPYPENAAELATTFARAKAKTPAAPKPIPPLVIGSPEFALLEASDHAAAAAQLSDASWRVRRAALAASRFRFGSEDAVAVTDRALAAALRVIAESAGVAVRDAQLARALALAVREQAYFPRDRVPVLGDRMTREGFYQAFRERGGVVLGEAPVASVAFVDRVVVAGSKVARASDYIALLRELASLPPRDALAQFDLDDAGYLDVARAWTAALDADPSLATVLAAGLAARS
ncbi:MAG TPA: tetratricopeptide repeat protein [Kofleriaceae bacterium]|jgi:tetratricopeptide (TPR) repeat protein